MRSPKIHPGPVVLVTLLVVALTIGAAAFYLTSNGESTAGIGEARPPFASNDPIERACNLEKEILVRIWRGHHPKRSEDITFVPRQPNFIGTFTLTSHSGPWRYLQNVPLVFYGPGHVTASGTPRRGIVNSTDVYPTVARLLQTELPARDGAVLEEAIDPSAVDPPRIVVVVVWDGAGRATLDRWPDRWPTLARMEREGTSYVDATVGSSPSITSVVHSTLGTGSFPRSHGIAGNSIRTDQGTLETTFSGLSAETLKLTTLADEYDRLLGNRPKVGLLGWKSWQIGMLGHGAEVTGGDADELALIQYRNGVQIKGNAEHFSTPTGITSGVSLQKHLDSLDRRDGELDGKWREHEISVKGTEATWLTYSNPAWAAYQAELVIRMIRGGSYGADRIPDLLFTNFKMTDLVGHRWGRDEPETADVLEAQDAALEKIVEYLEREIGDYVVVVTADHGAAPSATSANAWPIQQGQLIADLDAHFEVPEETTLVQESGAYGFFLDDALLARLGVTVDDVARFINAYTIDDNWTETELPRAYRERGNEAVFAAAWPSKRLDEVMECSFGADGPPGDLKA